MDSLQQCRLTAPCSLQMMAKRVQALMGNSILPPETLTNRIWGFVVCCAVITGIGWREHLKSGSVRYIVMYTINIPKGRGNRSKLLPRVVMIRLRMLVMIRFRSVVMIRLRVLVMIRFRSIVMIRLRVLVMIRIRLTATWVQP